MRGDCSAWVRFAVRGATTLRILYSHYLVDDAHPAALMVHSVAKALRARGHEVGVHRSAGLPRATGGPPKSRLSDRARAKVWFARALARNRAMFAADLKAVREFRPDVVLGRQDAYCFSMPGACTLQGVPLVTFADAPVAYETRLFGTGGGRWHPPGLVEALEAWTIRASREVITVSHPAARRLARYRLKTPIHVVPNGVAPARFPIHDPDERTRLRAALGLTAPLVLGFVGSFKIFHGIDRLRDLILATADRADTQWLLIGDGPERATLEGSLEGKARVVFAGRRPAEEVGSLLGLVDVAVAPHTLFGGDFYFCPLKILEYAAAGCAVVASDQGDIPLLLDHGKAGVLVSDNSIESWDAAVRDLLNDRVRRTALGTAARESVLKTGSWDANARRVEEILAGVTAAKGQYPTQSEAKKSHLEKAKARRLAERGLNPDQRDVKSYELEPG